MRWAAQVARMEARRGAYRILVFFFFFSLRFAYRASQYDLSN